MTIDDLDSWPRCVVMGCPWQVWPIVDEPRCHEHHGDPELAFWADEFGETHDYARPGQGMSGLGAAI